MSGDPSLEEYIAALDIGTTNVKCAIINSSASVTGISVHKIKILSTQAGWAEIDPDYLFHSIVEVVREAVKNADINFNSIKSLGISTHRATFITWKKDCGEHLHNLITWQDLRATDLLENINSSNSFSIFKWVTYILHLLTRNEKLGVASRLKISNTQVTGRLLWILSNNSEVKRCQKDNNLMFGTLDTWLLYKLTGGKIYVTDIANASATGLYDSFDLCWSIVAKFLRIPTNIFPEVVNNDFDFGMTAENIFGKSLKIGCVMPDQSASMFGLCCFNKNDMKVTMGTGAYIDVNTSSKIYPCVKNMYPVIGWKMNNELVYILEVPCLDTSWIIQLLLENGLVKDPSLTSEMAIKAEECNSLFFIPEFTNSEHPTEKNIVARFVGIESTTTPEQKVRAVLEAIVFRIAMCFDLLKSERKMDYNYVNVDGGVSRNDFVCQTMADLVNLSVTRMTSSEMTTMGVAYVIGLSCGMWKNRTVINSLRDVECVFKPNDNPNYQEKLKDRFHQWLKAVELFEKKQLLRRT